LSGQYLKSDFPKNIKRQLLALFLFFNLNRPKAKLCTTKNPYIYGSNFHLCKIFSGKSPLL